MSFGIDDKNLLEYKTICTKIEGLKIFGQLCL